MIDLKKLNNDELMQSTDRAVEHEKKAVTNTTRHFQEIYRRRSYLPAYPNMFALLTQKYGFCNGSAQLRIGVIELIRQVPVVQEKIERGELSMTAAADIQTFLNNEKRADRPYSVNAKIELVDACLGKSTREVRKEFVRRNPEIEKRESVRYTSEDRVRLETSLSEEAFKTLSQLRDILSHVDPNMTLGSLIERLAEDGMNKYCPKRKAERAKSRAETKASKNKSDSTPESHRNQSQGPGHLSDSNGPNDPNHPASETTPQSSPAELLHAHEVRRTRYIPAQEKHNVSYDGNGCAFVDLKSGRRCCSTKFLQLDHVEPFARGGENIADNLRWLCGVHNRWRSGEAGAGADQRADVFSATRMH